MEHSYASAPRTRSTSHHTPTTVSGTPSRIPRPSLSVRQTPTSASYARTSSPGRSTSLSGNSRKRPRPSSMAASTTVLQETPTYSTTSSPYFISPSASYFTTPTTWKHNDHVAHSLSAPHESPPPLINSRYTLAGGLDTPSIAAERRYERLERMDLDSGRFGRDQLADHMATEPFAREVEETSTILGTDRNGRGRGATGLETLALETSSWGKLVLGVVGGVVGGVWAFCKTTAFRGFTAGGGQAYPLRSTEDVFASESMWEDDTSLARSWDRLPTPLPGEYPGDTPSEEEEQDEYSGRGAKRLHTDGGGWVVVERARETNHHRARSPRLSTPGSHGQRLGHGRTTSASHRRHIVASGARHAHRTSGVSFAGSPAPQAQAGRVSIGRARSPTMAAVAPGKKGSPPSVEAKKFAAKMRREGKMADERIERLNDRLQDMIRQGKEALGSKVEVVDGEGNKEMW